MVTVVAFPAAKMLSCGKQKAIVCAKGSWVRPEVIFFPLEHDVKAVADCLVHATLLQPIGS
jgi:hypothetical protein